MIVNDVRDDYEIIGGKKFMAPAANTIHNVIGGRLYMFIGTYLDAKEMGYCFTDSADVYLPDGNLFQPDFSIVLKENEQIITWGGDIYGVPDMVVEILSKSTKKRDITIKKDAYEANGVGEYWIIDPRVKSVSVYLLRDGKYFLDDEYILFNEEDVKEVDWLKSKGEEVKLKMKFPLPLWKG